MGLRLGAQCIGLKCARAKNLGPGLLDLEHWALDHITDVLNPQPSIGLAFDLRGPNDVGNAHAMLFCGKSFRSSFKFRGPSITHDLRSHAPRHFDEAIPYKGKLPRLDCMQSS